MELFDNTIILYDKDGNEVEFEFLHECKYQGKTYYVAWSEETDDKVVVTENSEGDYEIVDDDDVLDYVKESFVEDMGNFMEEADALSDELSELDKKFDKLFDESEENTNSSESVVDSFDYEQYVLHSQDYAFKQALQAYENADFNRALELFKEASYQGNIFAYAHLGIMYHQGEGCEKNEELALSAFREGAAAGCPLAACWIAEFYRMGYAVEKDKDYAEKLLQKNIGALKEMCKAEDVTSLYFLGFNLIYGIGMDENDEEAVQLLEVGSYKGDSSCTILLAECYLNGWGVAENKEKAFRMLNDVKKLNKKGNFLLGRCYYHGIGTEQDFVKAVECFKKAANLNHGTAKDYLGDCYYNGQGIDQSYSEAAKWYKDAADNNKNGSSAHSLAFMYLKGEGLPEDIHKAIDYWHIAADKGITQAQRIISREYISGEYLEKDVEAGIQLLEIASNGNVHEACRELATRYHYGIPNFRGQALYKNPSEAQRLASIAVQDESDGKAQYILAKIIEEDFGNSQAAIEWYRKAVLNENKEAMLGLSRIYINTQSNCQEAVQMLSKLISEKNGEAQYLYAQCLENGYGCTKDKREAKKYYQLAQSNGYEGAKRKKRFGFF